MGALLKFETLLLDAGNISVCLMRRHRPSGPRSRIRTSRRSRASKSGRVNFKEALCVWQVLEGPLDAYLSMLQVLA